LKHKLVSILTVISACIVIWLANDSPSIFWGLGAVVVVFSLLTVYGVYQIRWNYFLDSVNRANGNDLVITFDDGPDPEITPRILTVLSENRIKANFFLIGKRAASYPDLVRRIVEEGHEIGNHSFSHSYDLGFFTERRLQDDLDQCSDVLSRILARKVLFFRPPFGVTNPRYARVLKRLQLTSVGWSLRSFDTATESHEVLLNRLVSNVKGGDIVLLHDTQEVTLEILPSFFDFCKKEGFQFRTLSESTGLPPYSDVV
jgi:peptidoglycan/xylan/chitin deacetylase (PgdA/CDA1 family)